MVATHQLIFLPWPGFFAKALVADYLVLLDCVQFPLGRGWVNRNRLKSDAGELWLTVPVHKKDRSFQQICDVEIYNEENWQKKHLQSLRHYYSNAPYFEETFAEVEKIYFHKPRFLADLNWAFIKFFWKRFKPKARIIRQSELKIDSKGTELIVNICQHFNSKNYLNFIAAKKYLDSEKMAQAGIGFNALKFQPPVYPQLWSDFIYNLSALDLWLNCGDKWIEYVRHGLR